MKLFLYIGMTALVLTACSSRENVSNDESEIANAITSCDSGSSGIVNGTSVTAQDPDSKRAVLLIIHRGKIVTSCTGTPISDRVILTAGHCLKDVKKGDVDVVFNSDISCSAMANSITATAIIVTTTVLWWPTDLFSGHVTLRCFYLRVSRRISQLSIDAVRSKPRGVQGSSLSRASMA